MGLPVRVVVSEKTLEKGGVEVKYRSSDEIKIASAENVLLL
ncbi:MAG: hypothetical protein HYT40_02780 [Candidatus Sungbacteria bacterium]|uniref:Anticodon-binding domain-containing protein n=1 Tax=Candidatus Sungiibacteriota bacterium TaxID=2750080 RepID=A0A931SBV4_9BACT|nr:hypothetical protein [Candidatus Sungbacteria bacterium]